MKKAIFKTLLLISFFAFTSSTSFGQSPDKSKLIGEINELFLSIKQWDYEGIVIDQSGSAKYHICLTPECNPYVSWDFYIKNLGSIQLGKFEEYTTVDFKCTDIECIIPTGYEKGGKYEPKKELQFFIKDAKKGKELVAKLNELKKLDIK